MLSVFIPMEQPATRKITNTKDNVMQVLIRSSCERQSRAENTPLPVNDPIEEIKGCFLCRPRYYDQWMVASVKYRQGVSAGGGRLHYLALIKPWLESTRPERTIPTIHDPLSELQEDQDRAYWEMENGSYDFGDLDEYDDGELVNTI